jgi:hypothetical protein
MTITNLTSGSSITSGTSVATASISVTAGRAYIISVATRTGITADPNQPTATGASLTITAMSPGSTIYDNSSSSRRRLTSFVAECTSTTSGAITFDFSGQTQTTFVWTIEEVTGQDTTTLAVQSAVNQDTTGTASSLAVTLGAFSSADNATYGVFATGDGTGTRSVGSGFTQLANLADSVNNIGLISEWKATNDTGVDFSDSTVSELGGVAAEIKAAAVAATGLGSNLLTLGVG